MTIQVNIEEAKTRLSELIARIEAGEEVVIARSGRPVAQLIPVAPAPSRTFGILELDVEDSFFEALPEEQLAAWE
ncbi:MAG: type II toxin-antitoxin system prevent-host-death family antitoxin [Dermatophilaceae bacterium]